MDYSLEDESSILTHDKQHKIGEERHKHNHEKMLQQADLPPPPAGIMPIPSL
jgi:hypothetical protein